MSGSRNNTNVGVDKNVIVASANSFNDSIRLNVFENIGFLDISFFTVNSNAINYAVRILRSNSNNSCLSSINLAGSSHVTSGANSHNIEGTGTNSDDVFVFYDIIENKIIRDCDVHVVDCDCLDHTAGRSVD